MSSRHRSSETAPPTPARFLQLVPTGRRFDFARRFRLRAGISVLAVAAVATARARADRRPA